MGRKRKTRWRRLSIGEISGNEDDGEEMSGAMGSLTRSLSSSQNHSPARVHPDKSQDLQNNSIMTNKGSSSSASTSLHNSSTNLSNGTSSSATLMNGSSGDSPKKLINGTTNSVGGGEKHGDSNSTSSGCNSSGPSSTTGGPRNGSPTGNTGSNNGGPNGYGNYHHSHNNHHYDSPSSHYDRYHYHKDNYRPPSYYNNYERSDRGGYHGNHAKDYHGGGSNGGGGYHHGGYNGGASHHYYRNGYNNYRNTHYNNGGSNNNGAGGGSGGGGGGSTERSAGGGGGGSGGGGSGGASSSSEQGYNNTGGSDYHSNYPHPPRPYGPGRFRRSRSYPASSYYYANGHGSGGNNANSDNTNKPSYNHDEYTKITTPRQDVLFKKGYLSQKKSQSSSVDSASTTTTPSASNNGTPDTQSTNGINSDYSEGYENGETDCVIPYDDAYYYGPPPEAVFTDPTTGQVYYGHCSSNGEYYDAYPVSPMMVAGYPAAVYYPVPYPIDWNGVPAPMYPTVVAVPPHPGVLEDPSCSLQGVLDPTPLNPEQCTISTSTPQSQPLPQPPQSSTPSKSDTAGDSTEGGSSPSSADTCSSSSAANPPNNSSSSPPEDSSPSLSASSSSASATSSCDESKETTKSRQPKGNGGKGKDEEKDAGKVRHSGESGATNNNNSGVKGDGRKKAGGLKGESGSGGKIKLEPSSSSASSPPSSLSSSSVSSPTSSAPVSPPGGTGSSIPPSSTFSQSSSSNTPSSTSTTSSKVPPTTTTSTHNNSSSHSNNNLVNNNAPPASCAIIATVASSCSSSSTAAAPHANIAAPPGIVVSGPPPTIIHTHSPPGAILTSSVPLPLLTHSVVCSSTPPHPHQHHQTAHCYHHHHHHPPPHPHPSNPNHHCYSTSQQQQQVPPPPPPPSQGMRHHHPPPPPHHHPHHPPPTHGPPPIMSAQQMGPQLGGLPGGYQPAQQQPNGSIHLPPSHQPQPHPMIYGGPHQPPPPPPGPPPYHHIYPSPPHPPHHGFVYGPPPVYNGIVVPIAPVAASAAASASSSTVEIDTVPSSQNSSRKKRKKRRREKEKEGQDDDDDEFEQLTDENSSKTPSPSRITEAVDAEAVATTTAVTTTQDKNTLRSESTFLEVEESLNSAGLETTKTKTTEKIRFTCTSSLDNNDQSITQVPSTTLNATIIPSESLPMQTSSLVSVEDVKTEKGESSRLQQGSITLMESSSSSTNDTSSSSVESSPSKWKVASRKEITEPSLVLPPPPPPPSQEKKGSSAKGNKRESKKSKSKNKMAHKLSAEVGKPKSTMEMADGDEERMKNDTSGNSNSNEDVQSGSNPGENTKTASSTNSSDDVRSTDTGSDSTASIKTSDPNDSLPATAQSASPSVFSKKPVDLTVKCPSSNIQDPMIMTPEALKSPSDSIFPEFHNPGAAGTEPSSPDSLNTTQSMAGSECGGCVENLSVSESDLLMMNRTTSIDEVDEDLPQEEQPFSSSEIPVIISGTVVPAPDLEVESSAGLVRELSLVPQEEVEVSQGKDEPGNECRPPKVEGGSGDNVAVPKNSEASLSPSELPETTELTNTCGESTTDHGIEKEEIIQPYEAEMSSCTEFLQRDSSIPVSSPVGELKLSRDVKNETIGVVECQPPQCEMQVNLKTKDNVEEESSLAKHEQAILTDSGHPNLPSSSLLEIHQDSPGISPGLLTEGEEVEVRLPHKEEGNAESSSSSVKPSLQMKDIRPKSITLAVSEWLKTQGEDALTPILPLRSTSPEFEGDIDEDSDTDEGEDDNESNANKSQNSKNVYGNPWAAPSNKSGPTKSMKSRSKGNNRVINQQQDGNISSRVALSSTPTNSSNVEENEETESNKKKVPQNSSTHYDSGVELSSPECTVNSSSGGETDSNTSTAQGQPNFLQRRKVLRKSEEREQQLPKNAGQVELGETPVQQEVKSSSASERSHSINSTPSLDESKDHAEICDPQKFAKYYQFGVVFDRANGDTEDVDDSDESSLVEDVTIIEDEGEGKSISNGTKDNSCGEIIRSIPPDFLQVMMNRNKALRKKVLPVELGREVVLRGYCDVEDDEEVGTYDPTVYEKRLSGAVKSFSNFPTNQPSCPYPSSSNHIYVNPMSLAKELVESSETSGEPLSDSWDVDSEPLPPYQPPSPVEIPVYNHLTPEARLIRKKLHAVGDPVSSTICCSIQ